MTRDSSDEQQGPAHPDQAEQDQGQGKGVPGAGQQEGHHLPGGGTAFVELHAHRQDAVTAQVQEHAGQGGPQQRDETVAVAQHRHHQVAGNPRQQADEHHAEGQAPPHLVEQLDHAVAAMAIPGFAVGQRETRQR